MENLTLLQNAFWRYAPVTKCYLWCGQTNNITCRYEYRIHVTSMPTGKWLNMSNYKIQYFCLSYDVAIIQWLTLCHKNRMTTR